MKEVNEHNEEYFKSVWMPLIVSLTFSCVQSADLAYGGMFFDINWIQIIDTFTICIYAAIIPARIVLFLNNNKTPKTSLFLQWFIGAGFYFFYSFTESSFNIIILLISLILSLASYHNLQNHLTKGASDGNIR